MNIAVYFKSNGNGQFGRLTTDHAASSYGIPVIVDQENNVVDQFDPMSVIVKGASSVAPYAWFCEGPGEDLKSTKTPQDLLRYAAKAWAGIEVV